MVDIPVTTWKGCYKDGWQRVIAPEAFAHPAKFARNLIQRLYQHLEKEGWLTPGDMILDPFGGVALGAYPAMHRGYRWIGVELEQHFVDLGQGCDCTGMTKQDWLRFYGRWERVRYTEGRHWCPACLAQAKTILEPRKALADRHRLKSGRPFLGAGTEYWQDSGLIPSSQPHRYQGNIELWQRKGHMGAQLIQGDSRELLKIVETVACVVSSPPYAEALDEHRLDRGPGAAGKRGRVSCQPNYSDSPANLGNLPPGTLDAAISSPPYATGDSAGPESLHRRSDASAMAMLKDQHWNGGGQVSPGNLAACALGTLDAAISSPPYATHTVHDGTHMRVGMSQQTGYSHSPANLGNRKLHTGTLDATSTTPDNLGNIQCDTFWASARVIVEQTYALLKPQGIACWIVKAYVRDGQIVDFPGQWRRLCEHVGFTTLHEHHALLTESHGIQGDLFGEDTEHRVKKISFFRRLHETKRPDLAIEYEVVYCMQKGYFHE